MRKNHYVATTFEIIIPIGLIILGNIAIPKTENEMNNDPLSFEPFMINSCSVRHGYYEKILYEPSTPFTNELMSKAACYAGYRKSSEYLQYRKLSNPN